MTGDQCAIGPLGNLLDASEIEWHHDPDDQVPLPRTASTSLGFAADTVQESEPVACEGQHCLAFDSKLINQLTYIFRTRMSSKGHNPA